MGFIFAAIVVAVIAEIFILKLYKDGDKQLSKYDKEHSSVRISSPDDLVSTIKVLPNSGADNIEVQGNDINLTLKNNRYTINVENNIASVKYDKAGTEIRFSMIGKILKPFRYSKSAKKAVIINSLFDKIVGKDSDEKESKKVTNDTNIIVLSLLAMIFFIIVGIVNVSGDAYGAAITKVKNTEYFNGVTYGTLLDGYIENPEWKAFITDGNTAVVEVDGTSVENEKICIQFLGSSGQKFYDIDKQTFYIDYFEADGMFIDLEGGMDFIYRYLGY